MFCQFLWVRISPSDIATGIDPVVGGDTEVKVHILQIDCGERYW